MGRLNLCGACGQDFASVEAFDRHRVGVHEYTYAEGLRMEPIRENGRRCLQADEIRELGFVLNDRGRWHDPIKAANTAGRLRGAPARAHRPEKPSRL